MKAFIFLFIAFILCITGKTQTCNLSIKDGSKTTINIQSFTNPLLSDQNFLKAKEEQKEIMIEAYNAKVLSGEIKPASNYPMNFGFSKTDMPKGAEYKIGYKIGNVDYYSYVVCSNDTLFSYRNRGYVAIGSAENPLGFTLQGPTIYPMNMKVGDLLSACEDAGFLFPSKTDLTVKKKVFSHMETSVTQESGLYVDSETGRAGSGNYTLTSTKAIYNTIDVKVRQNLSFSSHSFQNMNARVTGEEELTISGVNYKAFIIEAESWTKLKVDASYESADEAVNKEQKAFAEKVQNKMEKQMIKKQFTNSLGYLVLYSKAWFVPQLGSAVKTVSYDTNGGIASIMTTTAID